jgi:hypothetical protein
VIYNVLRRNKKRSGMLDLNELRNARTGAKRLKLPNEDDADDAFYLTLGDDSMLRHTLATIDALHRMPNLTTLVLDLNGNVDAPLRDLIDTFLRPNVLRPNSKITSVVCIPNEQKEIPKLIFDYLMTMTDLKSFSVQFPARWTSASPFVGQVKDLVALRRLTTLGFYSYIEPLEARGSFSEMLEKGNKLEAFELGLGTLMPFDSDIIECANAGGIRRLTVCGLQWRQVALHPYAFEEICVSKISSHYADWKAFVRDCAASTTLRVLDVDSFSINGNESVGPELANLVSASTSLRVLQYKNCSLGSEEAVAIADAANGNARNVLHVLDLHEKDTYRHTFTFAVVPILEMIAGLLMSTRDAIRSWTQEDDLMPKYRALDEFVPGWRGMQVEQVEQGMEEIMANLFNPGLLNEGPVWNPDTTAIVAALLRTNYLFVRILGMKCGDAEDRESNLVWDFVRRAALVEFAPMNVEKSTSLLAEFNVQGGRLASLAMGAVPLANAARALLVEERRGILADRRLRSQMGAFESAAGPRNGLNPLHRLLHGAGDGFLKARLEAFLR